MSCDVFISYGRNDREIVAAIARRLEERGLAVWYDPRIGGDQALTGEIRDRLREATIFSLFFSDACNESKQVREELALADAAGKPVVPVLLEQAMPRGSLLFDLADRNWVRACPDPHMHADELAALLAQVAGKKLPGDRGHAAPTNPAAYVGRQDVDGAPSQLVTGKTYRVLNALTLGLYGWVARDRAIRNFEDNIRTL